MEERNRQLSEFMKNGRPEIPMSVNERSFEIFGNEKFLMSQEGQSLLKKNHISMAFLNVYKTPEPFIYYLNENSASGNVLIIENKDTWYTVRKALKEGRKILGKDFCAVIYGEGRKIQNSFEYIEEDEVKELRKAENFYYFGDIDSSGLDILFKLTEKYKAYHIKPFEEGYRLLYNNKERRRKKEVKSVPFHLHKIIGMFPFFALPEKQEILAICNQNEIIPQEILSYKEIFSRN